MKFLLVYILLGYVAVFVKSHNEFTPEGCLLVHNELRALHKDTLSVEYDAELEKSAEQSANFVKATGGGEDTRPTRVLPKRRRRHVEDIDKNVHIESWDGDIYYPDTSFTPQGTGESIHKMCCRTAPHCPREFFHGLLFPPSAEGVVRDFYNEEMKSYDFASGKKKAQFYTQIKHFTNIVWKKTSKIGCFQTKMDSNNCVYTVIHYKEKGSEGTPEIFKENVGVLLDSEEDSTNIVLIFLIVFFIVLFLVLVILCYCCRDRLSEKYYEIKIKTDTMKAEQELETDSTAFWWLKIFKKRRRTVKRPTRARSTKTHQSLRDRNISIEVVHTVKPQRSIKQPHRARGQTLPLFKSSR
ncbi:uncharacterized protein [Clytia hemisphaerica]|uniref:uncharacterized protein n=1 Tax=Clytia hemisphaerica TaxID=252671 RepID=UPI0034D5BBD0